MWEVILEGAATIMAHMDSLLCKAFTTSIKGTIICQDFILKLLGEQSQEFLGAISPSCFGWIESICGLTWPPSNGFFCAGFVDSFKTRTGAEMFRAIREIFMKNIMNINDFHWIHWDDSVIESPCPSVAVFARSSAFFV